MNKPLIIIFLLSHCIAFSEPSDTLSTGKISLTFVFDVTGSMHDDLMQVIRGATQIYNATLQQDYPIQDYILIPFGDPGKTLKQRVVIKVLATDP